MKLTETVQTADFKSEKHVPVIHVEKAEGLLKIKALVGEEIEHPNTLEHHIAWIKVFFQPEGEKFPVEVASYQAAAHGEGEVFTKPHAHAYVKSNKPGKVFALSYCNIHGLWESAEEVK